MVSIGSITYIGSHGAELLESGWTESVLDPASREWTDRIDDVPPRRPIPPSCAGAASGSRTRAPIVAFHWRGAVDEEAAQAAVDALPSRRAAVGLEVHWGRKVMEARPPLRIDKGAGLTALLRVAPLDDRRSIAGDDVTDLDAFRALRELLAAGRFEHAVLRRRALR